MEYDYPSPVDKLLTYGAPPIETIPNYLDLGFTHAHVQALIRMATDENLLGFEDADSETGWAPIHAWRTLQQLHADEALEPLTKLFDIEDNEKISNTGITEWISEEIPELYASFGTVALPILKSYLQDMSHQNPFAISNVADALVNIAEQEHSVRDECVAAITERLEHFEENGELLNAFLIANLTMDFKATETFPLIEQVFTSGNVDEGFLDLEDAQVGIGLKQERETPRKPLFPDLSLLSSLDSKPRMSFSSDKKIQKSKKAKRNQAKKSKKINRKKKK